MRNIFGVVLLAVLAALATAAVAGEVPDNDVIFTDSEVVTETVAVVDSEGVVVGSVGVLLASNAATPNVIVNMLNNETAVQCSGNCDPGGEGCWCRYPDGTCTLDGEVISCRGEEGGTPPEPF